MHCIHQRNFQASEGALRPVVDVFPGRDVKPPVSRYVLLGSRHRMTQRVSANAHENEVWDKGQTKETVGMSMTMLTMLTCLSACQENCSATSAAMECCLCHTPSAMQQVRQLIPVRAACMVWGITSMHETCHLKCRLLSLV